MREVSCNLCGADDSAVLFPKQPGRGIRQRIVKCRRCGLMYANPQEIIDCETFAQEGEAGVLDIAGADRQYFQKQHVQLPDYERIVGVLAQLAPKKGRLLEIGSYLGILLDRLRADGWTTTGLEPSHKVAVYSRERYGHDIIEGLLPHPALPAGAYDTVLLLHVIEHMPDPAESVREIRRLMKPGGVLVVETPRFDSLMFKLLGRRERSLNNCAGHLFFFAVPTLSQLLERNGFEVVRVDLVGRTLTLDRLLYNVGLITQSKPIRDWLWRMGVRLRLDRVKVHVNARDMQRIYCRAK